MPPKDRAAALQAQLGKALKERDDYKRQVDDLRFQLNFGKQFAGDSKALLTATYKAEYYPSQEQLYAAKTLLEKEYPSDAGDADALAPTSAEAEEAAEYILADLQRRREKRVAQARAVTFLHELVDAGELTLTGAARLRKRNLAELGVKDFDEGLPSWLANAGHGTDTKPTPLLQHIDGHGEKGDSATDDRSDAAKIPQPNGAANGAGQPPVEPRRVLFTDTRFERFWIAGRSFTADRDGVVDITGANWGQVQALLKQACRTKR